MEVKKGFKRTEVGILPENWTIAFIPEIISKNNGIKIGPFGSQLKKELLVQSGFKVYGQENVFEKNMEIGDRYINSDHFNRLKSCELKSGDFIISMMGTIGKIMIVPKSIQKGIMDSHLLRLRLNEESICPDLLQHYFTSNILLDQVAKLSVGGIMDGLSSKIIKNIAIPLPPTKSEQIAIATALSDADAFITSLEKLIEKRRAIKQGAIQKLLTGKERLAGYSGSWIDNSFPEMCWFQEGPGLRNWQFTSDGIKVINVTNLVAGYLNLDRTARYIAWAEFDKMYKHFEIAAGDIVVASSGNSYAKVAVVRKQDLPLVMNTSVIRFKPLKNLDYNFLLAFLKSNYFKDQIDLLITGGAQPNFGPYHLRKIIIKVPPTKQEQVHIGKILADVDTELEGLEQKLSKYRLLKQGMMQELLTGKIRLI